jgi:hypothetical protein
VPQSSELRFFGLPFFLAAQGTSQGIVLLLLISDVSFHATLAKGSRLEIGIATTVVRCRQSVPCLSTEEMFVCVQRANPYGELDASENLSYHEYPDKILETSERVT